VKGYFLSKIMYGEDRLTRPLLRMKNGRYDKAGEFTPVSWDQAFDIMAEKWKAALKKKGPSSVGMFMSGPVDHLGRLRRGQADEGRLPLEQHRPQRAPLHGERRGRLHAHLRHGRADGLLRRHRGRRRVRAVGLEHGRDAPDPVGRVADRRLAYPHVQVAVLSTFEHRSYDLADLRSPSARRPISRS
jgi:nitrate reductase NapA